jgi:hypothetical protein
MARRRSTSNSRREFVLGDCSWLTAVLGLGGFLRRMKLYPQFIKMDGFQLEAFKYLLQGLRLGRLVFVEARPGLYNSCMRIRLV